MAVQGIPALAVDTSTDAPSDQNARRLSTWSKGISPRMYAVDAPMHGTLPIPNTPSDAYLMIAGEQAVAFSAGSGLLTFPRPFPNGLLSISLTTPLNRAAPVAFGPLYAGTYTAASVQLYYAEATGPLTGTIAVIYQAIGW